MSLIFIAIIIVLIIGWLVLHPIKTAKMIFLFILYVVVGVIVTVGLLWIILGL
jgi:hypothetical protein